MNIICKNDIMYCIICEYYYIKTCPKTKKFKILYAGVLLFNYVFRIVKNMKNLAFYIPKKSYIPITIHKKLKYIAFYKNK